MLQESHINFLRDKFAHWTRPAEKAAGIKTIALVGAVPRPSEESGLKRTDVEYLGMSLEMLAQIGRHVHRTFVPEVFNINEEFGGRDYMSPSDTAVFDLSVFCYIKRHFRPRTPDAPDVTNATKPSPHESRTKHSWKKAALRHQSRVLTTFGGTGLIFGMPFARDVMSEDFTIRSPWNQLRGKPAEYNLMIREPFKGPGFAGNPYLGEDIEYQCFKELILHKDFA